jgi:hypothetical protein
MNRLLCLFLAVLMHVIASSASPSGSAIQSVRLPAETRAMAKKLIQSWVDTAGATTLDGLANRSIAFAGLVPNVTVFLDGKRFDASRALVDSALTIIKSNSNDADAAAIRNTVYILREIAEGRTTKSKP